MDCGDHKVSAERCLFLLLLNEDGLEENRRKSGKDRLTAAWEFKGQRWPLGREERRMNRAQRPHSALRPAVGITIFSNAVR